MGNPSSRHRAGRIAKEAIDRARQKLGRLLQLQQQEQIVFTGSGTEANHLAIQGIAATCSAPGTIAVGATEHASLRAAVEPLEQLGWRCLLLPVDQNGLLTSTAVEQVQRERPALVSVMVANNETGVVQQLEPLIKAATNVGAKIHLDGSQAAGKIALDFAQMGGDCMTLSAHKLYGPKGVGALVMRSNLRLRPLLSGGGQESGLRSGTENVPAIVGFGEAARVALEEMESSRSTLQQCREQLEQGLKRLPGVEIVAQAVQRLPNTVMFLVPAIEGETLLMQLDQQGAECSSGSACQAGKTAPNPVLTAMGFSPEEASRAIRVSLCRDIQSEGIVQFLALLERIVSPLVERQRAAWS